jgi:hypothetical protein
MLAFLGADSVLSLKFRILHKRSNMPCGDKHVKIPCGRLRSVTKFPKGDKKT